MVTVALVGADGAGKTTVARRLEEEAPFPMKRIYMGINPEASNYLLPTSRLLLRLKRRLGKETDQGGPPDPERRRARPRSLPGRLLRSAKSALRTANQIADELYRLAVARRFERRGFVVLFDRHFFPDYFAHDITGRRSARPLSRRLHGFFLEKIYPRPDLLVLLDAPAEVLFARKGEGSVELVERRRREYLELRDHVPAFAVVDASRPLDEVVRDVLRIAGALRRERSGD